MGKTLKEKADIHPIEQHAIDLVTKLRRSRKMTQEDIAHIIETTKSFVGNVENVHNAAKYNLKHLNMIADHFCIAPKDFLPDRPVHHDFDDSRT